MTKSLLPKTAEEIQENLEALMNSAHAQGGDQAVALLQELCALLANDQDIDLSLLEEMGLFEIAACIEKIREELEALLSKDPEIRKRLEIVLGHLFGPRVPKEKEKEQEEEHEHEMAPAQLKIYRMHLRVMMYYEIYKFLNPRQIAGETKLENFINNVVHLGLEIAEKYAGIPQTDNKNSAMANVLGNFLQDLQVLHKEFVRDAGAFMRTSHSLFDVQGATVGNLSPDITPTVSSILAVKEQAAQSFDPSYFSRKSNQ